MPGCVFPYNSAVGLPLYAAGCSRMHRAGSRVVRDPGGYHQDLQNSKTLSYAELICMNRLVGSNLEALATSQLANDLGNLLT